MPTSKTISITALLAGAITVSAAEQPNLMPVEMLHTLPDLEVTLWAASPMIKNPTNIDTDKDGRIWVAEGVNYRSHYERQPEGDRIMSSKTRTAMAGRTRAGRSCRNPSSARRWASRSSTTRLSFR